MKTAVNRGRRLHRGGSESSRVESKRGRDLGRLGCAELAARGAAERPDDFDADLRGVQLVPCNGGTGERMGHFW